jgi:antitoxin VapB
MAFSIKNDEADRLVRDMTALTGESLTDAVIASLRERLVRQRRLRSAPGGDAIAQAVSRLRRLEVLDDRADEAIIGYDERGVPA